MSIVNILALESNRQIKINLDYSWYSYPFRYCSMNNSGYFIPQV